MFFTELPTAGFTAAGAGGGHDPDDDGDDADSDNISNKDMRNKGQQKLPNIGKCSDLILHG